MRIAVRPEPKQHCDCHDLSLILMNDDGDVEVDKDMSYEDAQRVIVALCQELVRNGVHGVAPLKLDGSRNFVVTI